MTKYLWIMIMLAAFYFIGLCARNGNYYELQNNAVVQITPTIPTLVENINVESVKQTVDVRNMIQMGAYE